MIFKKNIIERKASEILANELLNTPNFHFTNACYGGRRGDVLGTIEMKKPHQEHLIQVILLREGGWDDAKHTLVKHFDGVYWNPERREYHKDVIIATYYAISNDVYSDNEEEAKAARALSLERYNKKTISWYGSRSKVKAIQPNTKLYDKLFTECAKVKPVKYGTEITYKVSYRDDYKYDEGEKVGITKVSTEVTFTYRNKPVTINLNRFNYDNPHAQFYR